MVIDKPLAILTAVQWLNQMSHFAMFKYLLHDIDSHCYRQNGFEGFLVFYLRMVFKTVPQLERVFTFRKDFAEWRETDLAWQQEQFELVTIVNNSNGPQVSVVTSSSGGLSSIGFIAASGREVLDWISTNEHQSTFCFPPESFGPDILFFVRSKVSEHLLLVVIQAQKRANMPKQTLIHGVRTITPSWFWKSKNEKVCPFLQAISIDLSPP
jgi:hypothetical protein